MLRRLLLIVLLLGLPGAAARAEPQAASLAERFCHAVTAIAAEAPPAGIACPGEPAGYEDRRLWLTADLSSDIHGDEGAVLLVHQSRFDRLSVRFDYEDGSTVRYAVSAGNYESHWRLGGQLAFSAPAREARLTSVTLAFDRLADHSLLRVRLLPAGAAARDVALAAALIGGALTLLALSGGYNLLLARASRQGFVLWHAAWVASVLLWGLFWSQLALLAFPAMAGTPTARLCTLLATLAIAFAASCAATCPEAGTVPRWSRRLVWALGASVALMGVPVAFGPPAAVDLLGAPLSAAVLALLAAVTLLIGLAWRRGCPEARSFFLAWGLPMVVLAATELVDMGTGLFGGGPQMAVLLASAFQTVWLSIATTLRLARFRDERDAARAAQAELRELARRDPLTGSLNRRGFVERVERALAAAEAGGPRFALLVIDVDHFKSINDRFGHDSGDGALQRIAQRLDQLAGPAFAAGRLGGEEFALGASGLSPSDLAAFAERVRIGLGQLSVSDPEGGAARISVSIGVAEADGGSGFEALYRRADQALYAAKKAGRDRVVFAGAPPIGAAPVRRMRAA